MDITVAEVDKLLAIAKWLKSPPPLPDGNENLLDEAWTDAKRQLTEEAKRSDPFPEN